MKNSKALILLTFSLISMLVRAQSESVTFHYLGHASFVILFDDEVSVLTDYGKPNAYLEYGWDSPIYTIGDFQPTVCTYSHAHDDHYDSTRISSDDCIVLKKADTLVIKNLAIYPILTSEDELSLKDNRSFLIVYKGMKILHLGDCQANIIHIDSAENENFIKENIPLNCDVVLMPIEGKSQFIPQLRQFIKIIHPKTVIPMHYWSNEYKQDFLNYLEDNNCMSETMFKITSIDDSKFIYDGTSASDTIIHILSISPSDFHN